MPRTTEVYHPKNGEEQTAQDKADDAALREDKQEDCLHDTVIWDSLRGYVCEHCGADADIIDESRRLISNRSLAAAVALDQELEE